MKTVSFKPKKCKNKKRKVKAQELLKSFKEFKTIENRKGNYEFFKLPTKNLLYRLMK